MKTETKTKIPLAIPRLPPSSPYYLGTQRGISLWGQNTPVLRAIVSDPDFIEARTWTKEYPTLLSDHNLANFFLLFKLNQLPPGRAIVEFGVAKGGSLLFLNTLTRKFYPQTRTYGFDTFTGIPFSTVTPRDHHQAGDFKNPENEIKKLKILALSQGIELIQGPFESTKAQVPDKIILCHVDCDTYSSVRQAIEFSWPKLVPSGLIIFDDALHPTCLGALEAVADVLIRRLGLNPVQNLPSLVFQKEEKKQ